MKRHARFSRGITLLDALVGIALMAFFLVGVGAAFQLSLSVVTSSKARAGAIALADQRMEYVRSLAYSSVGTLGGIPSGTIPQSEAAAINGINYARRTFIEYEDDPKDGSGSADKNGITEDFKSVKVDVSWSERNGAVRHVTLVSRVSPGAGLESNVPGGTLTVNAVNAQGMPLPGALVSIVNASATPAVNISTFTDASGTATILGAPAAAGYGIAVTQSGYSTAQTYSVSAQNANPNPGNLTVALNQTTAATFAIDVLGQKTLRTWTPVSSASWSDPFSDASKLATSSGMTLSGGKIALAATSTSGEAQSAAIGPQYLAQWKSATSSEIRPAGSAILYRVYDGSGNPLPNSALPGNAAGFSAMPIDLSSLSTSTYPTLRLDAVFAGSSAATPALDSWGISYGAGPTPLPNVALSVRGAKTIGLNGTTPVYKYSAATSTGLAGSVTIANLEWDSYSVSENGATSGYDVSSACNPQPEPLLPGASLTSDFYFAPHTANSLLVDVHFSSSGAAAQSAYVQLSSAGYSSSSVTDRCGNAFFPNLSASATYTLSAGMAGHATTTASTAASGSARASVLIN